MKRRVKENEIANKKTRSFLVCHENGTSKLVRHTLTGEDSVVFPPKDSYQPSVQRQAPA